MKGLFITGTDTGIGKTVCTGLLLAELRGRGINAAPMKPVQTGCLKRDTITARKLATDCGVPAFIRPASRSSYR